MEVGLPHSTEQIRNGLQSIEKYREGSVKAAYSGTRVQPNYRVVLRQGLHSQDLGDRQRTAYRLVSSSFPSLSSRKNDNQDENSL